jgi:predicted permease
MIQILSVFIDVVLPVFCIVAIAYAAGPRLGLKAQTLSKTAYYILIPAFTFNMISRADISFDTAARMFGFVAATHLIFVLIGLAAAKLMKASRQMTAAMIMVLVFANIGNFGLALIDFKLGSQALVPATIYFVLVVVSAFIICVAAAGWAGGGKMSAVWAVFKTPGLIVVAPALLFAVGHIPQPLILQRVAGLLGSAMIPTMLLILGLQLAEAGRLKLTREVAIATVLRLVGGPAVAFAVVDLFGITGLVRATGILQTSMPVAIIVSIIAMEHNTAPKFVTATILYSTIFSLVSLSILLNLL